MHVLLNFLTLFRLFCLFASAAFSAAAGNPLQLGYQEGPACPYKGKLTRGALTHVNVKR